MSYKDHLESMSREDLILTFYDTVGVHPIEYYVKSSNAENHQEWIKTLMEYYEIDEYEKEALKWITNI